MHMCVPNAIRMACPDMPGHVAIRWGILRKPRGVTDRAEIHRCRVNVIADCLQPLEDGLPLLPVQLPQERPQSLDERILQKRFAVRFGNEEPVQPHIQRFRDLFQRAETGRHLPALDSREIGARHFRARLQLALGHGARFPQLADPLPDVLHGLLVDELLASWLSRRFFRRWRRRNHKLQALRQCAHATPAISRARPVLYQSTRLAADDFPVHLERVHFVFIDLCRHRCSLLTLFFRRADRRGTSERSHRGKTVTGATRVSCESHFRVKSIFVLFFDLLRFSSRFTPSFRCPFVQSLPFRPILFRQSLCARLHAPIQLVATFFSLPSLAFQGPRLSVRDLRRPSLGTRIRPQGFSSRTSLRLCLISRATLSVPYWETTACRRAMTPGNCSATTRNPNRSAN